MTHTVTLRDGTDQTVHHVTALVDQFGGQVVGQTGDTLDVEPKYAYEAEHMVARHVHPSDAAAAAERRNVQAAHELVAAVERSPLVVSQEEQARVAADAQAETERRKAEAAEARAVKAATDARALAEADRKAGEKLRLAKSK